jgi:uncharacterized protein (DUF169 family)
MDIELIHENSLEIQELLRLKSSRLAVKMIKNEEDI